MAGTNGDGRDTLLDLPWAGDDLSDVTPTDNPGAAVRRFTGVVREFCHGFENLSPILDGASEDDLPFLLTQFAALLGDMGTATDKLRDAMIAQLEVITVFRPRKDPPP